MNNIHRYWCIGDDPKQKLITYKQCYQEAKKQKKLILFKNIVCVLRNEIKIEPNNKYGNAQETIEYLLDKSLMYNTFEGFSYWLTNWELYFKTVEDAMNRLKCAKKGIKPHRIL